MGTVPEGGTVLDPFLGGSTALAAKVTGRRCVGIELSPEYARIAAERIKTA
ncbi:DNA methyltransferase [Bilophila wadsworthia]